MFNRSPIDEQFALETKPPLPSHAVASIEAKRGSLIPRSVSQEAHSSFVEREVSSLIYLSIDCNINVIYINAIMKLYTVYLLIISIIT